MKKQFFLQLSICCIVLVSVVILNASVVTALQTLPFERNKYYDSVLVYDGVAQPETTRYGVVYYGTHPLYPSWVYIRISRKKNGYVAVHWLNRKYVEFKKTKFLYDFKKVRKDLKWALETQTNLTKAFQEEVRSSLIFYDDVLSTVAPKMLLEKDGIYEVGHQNGSTFYIQILEVHGTSVSFLTDGPNSIVQKEMDLSQFVWIVKQLG